ALPTGARARAVELSVLACSRRSPPFAELPDADAQHPPERLGNQRRPARPMRRGAEWIDARGRRLSLADRMHLPVVEHIPDRVGRLARRSENVRVVAV